MFTFFYVSNDQFYVGSTVDLEERLRKHGMGLGANFASKHLPVKLVYYEEFSRIDEAFAREKQLQHWSHKKKQALIDGDITKPAEACYVSLKCRRRACRGPLNHFFSGD